MSDHATMKPYSEDLRKRIVRAVEEGMSKSAAARLFGVSLSSVKRYMRLASREASLSPKRVVEDHSRRMKLLGSCSKKT